MKKKLLYLLVIVLSGFILFSSAGSAFASHSYTQQISLKDPLLSGVFSFLLPGLGQFYSEQPVKGVIFFISENVLLFSSILSFSDLNISFVKDFGFSCYLRLQDNLTALEISSAIGFGIAFLILHIYNIYDAVDSASTYNASQFERMGIGNEMLGLNLYLTPDVRGVSYSFRY